MIIPQPVIRALGRQPYEPVMEAMRRFTLARGATTPDELWFLEHEPVFTQGQAGRAEHVLDPGGIAVVQSDRGGQITYHGPGQLVVYCLLDLRRLGYGVRGLVERLERAVIACLAGYGIAAHARREAPGVYVTHDFKRSPLPATGSASGPPLSREGERGIGRQPAATGSCIETRKIASLGLRVRRGCSYHGIALNVALDLAPFSRINPCGFRGLRMTQISELGGPSEVETVSYDLRPYLLSEAGLTRFHGSHPRLVAVRTA